MLLFFPLADKSYNPHPFCMVTYHIPPGFTPTIVSHGNSKSSKSFFPTLPSTSADIKEKCSHSGPKQVVADLDSSVGGLVGASYPGQLARSEQQITYYKRHAAGMSSSSSEANDLYSIMLQAQMEDKGAKFIRDVKTYPEPAIVVATEQQLFDVQRFCCNPKRFSILTVDPTFSLGDFDVTPTTYRHLLLHSKRTEQSPVMLGPTMIHYKKTFTTYKFLASCIICQNRELAGLCCFGTDGEKPLIDAFQHEFKSAVHLTCFNHVRRNIKDKLRELMVPDEVQTEVLNDIFGKRIGSCQLTGLVDSSTNTSFEEKFELLRNKWRLHDLNDECGQLHQFLDWFGANKRSVILKTMLLPVRQNAGLGLHPEPFYTNSSECINNVLKVKMDYKRNELCQFVEKLHQLVDDQQQEVEKALVGIGKYNLSSECSELEIPQGKCGSQ